MLTESARGRVKGLVHLLVPGIVLHELTHAAVAWPQADVRLYWSDPAVEMVWAADAPWWWKILAHLAPLLVGYLLALGCLAALSLGVLPDLRPGVWIALGLNWLYFTFATAKDIDIFLRD